MTKTLLFILAALAVMPLGAQGNQGQGKNTVSPTNTEQSASASATLLGESGFDIPTKTIDSADFSLDSLSGAKLSLGSLKGKLVFLNFWATWCGPCNIELPAIKVLYERLKSKGLVVLAVDLAEDRKTVERFVRAKGMQFPVVLDATGQVGALYGASSIPTTFIIDRSGKILGRKVGVDNRAWDSPESIALFEKLLAM